MSTAPISPPEEDLKTAVLSLKKEHPALGIAKLHALLLSENPAWTVSEKRLRRILKNSDPQQQLQQQQQQQRQAAGSVDGGSPAGRPSTASETHAYPSSALVEGLDVAKWTTAVEVHYFDRRKGKGLVAKEQISEGQVVWKEDPFVIAPEW
jgi:hypothetical protein